MGWASASDIVNEVWLAIEPLTRGKSDYEIRSTAERICKAFEGHDADTLDECNNPIGWASRHLKFVRRGAPPSPAVGLTWRDGEGPRDPVYTWDGRRWVYTGEEG